MIRFLFLASKYFSRIWIFGLSKYLGMNNILGIHMEKISSFSYEDTIYNLL